MKILGNLLVLLFGITFTLNSEQPLYKWALIQYDSHCLPKNLIKQDGSRVFVKRDRKGNIIQIIGPQTDYRYFYNNQNQVKTAVNKTRHTRCNKVYSATGKLIRDSISPGIQISYTYGKNQDTINIAGYAVLQYTKTADALIIRRLTPSGEELYKKVLSGDFMPKPVHEETYPTTFTAKGNPSDAVTNEYNELISYQETTCAYDDNGNLIRRTSPESRWLYKYDVFNRLELALDEEKELSVRYIYDPLGRRIEKIVKQANTTISHDRYLFLGNLEIGTIDKNNQLRELRVPLDPGNSSTPISVAVELEGNYYHVESDQIGRITKLTDMKTLETYHYQITAFGRDKNSEKVPFCPWAFASKRYDPETKLFYFGNRYYDPELLRWTTPDPLGNFLGPNVYAYCQCDPLHYRDLDGRLTLPLLTIAWGAGTTISAPATLAIATTIAAGWAVKKGYDWYKQSSNTENSDFSPTPSQTAPTLEKKSIFSDFSFLEIADSLAQLGIDSMSDRYTLAQKTSPNPYANRTLPGPLPDRSHPEEQQERSPYPKTRSNPPYLSSDDSFGSNPFLSSYRLANPEDPFPVYVSNYAKQETKPLWLQEVSHEKKAVETQPPASFKDKAMETLRYILHEAYEELCEWGETSILLREEIRSLISQLIPEQSSQNDNFLLKNSTDEFKKLTAKGHAAIDKAFACDHTDPQYKKPSNPDHQPVVGVLPPPLYGSFAKIFPNLDRFKQAGKALDRQGFTKAGRALMKHGNRKKSIFPKPSGNPAEMNRRGQKILEEILDDPNNQVYRLKNGGMKVYASDGKGVSFEKDGSFRGFIEKQYEKEIFDRNM